MKPLLPTLVAVTLLAAVFSSFAEDTNTPLPTVESVLQRVIQRAKCEDDNERAFAERYRYTRTKVTEYRNLAGELKKREEKTHVHDPTVKRPPPTTLPKKKTVSQNNQEVSDTHSNVRGRQFEKEDIVLNDDLISHFVFTLVGREWLNGRPSLVIDFVPANRKVPERNLKERFINKAAGRLWIDEADYRITQVNLYLTRKMNIGLGLIAAVWKFTYGFERERTADGLWFARTVNWHLEGREVVIKRIVDYHETLNNVQKIDQPAVQGMPSE